VGSLTLPATGSVYFDTNPVIYSVEKHPAYWPLLQPVWQAAAAKAIEIVSSDLVLMETLVGPLKSSNSALVQTYEQLFQQNQTRLLPITQPILRRAASLRATSGFRTPDAIHAATALDASCALLLTNDAQFRSLTGLNVVILGDLLKP
jgi:predicted nucleic acid-binding protein